MTCQTYRSTAAALIALVALTLTFSGVSLAQEKKRAPAPEASEEPPRLKDRGATGINNPPSGLWGSSPDGKNDGGLPQATGSAYNYTHIALGSGVVACAAVALLLLIRRHSTARKRAA